MSLTKPRNEMLTSRGVFRGHVSANQTGLSTGVWTKCTLDTEDYDLDGWFATSRFTPQVAGKYFCFGTATADGAMQVGMYKNTNAQLIIGTGATAQNPAIAAGIFDMNGTTDYVELFVYLSTGSVLYAPYSALQGFRVG